MKLKQLREQAEILAIKQSCFELDVPPTIPILIHQIMIDGQTVGYVATEDYDTAAGPHIFIAEGYKNPSYLKKVTWIFHNVYCPLMKELGKDILITNCDQCDFGTTNFLQKLGFQVKHLAIAEFKLY